MIWVNKSIIGSVLILIITSCEKKAANTGNLESKIGKNIIKRHYVKEEYSGVIPCADCNGIRINIKFYNDNIYEQIEIYMNRNHDFFKETGEYNIQKGWNGDSSSILYDLDDEAGIRQQYYVKYNEHLNELTKLDINMKAIEPKHKYKLHLKR